MIYSKYYIIGEKLQFNEYLKECRVDNDLTQEQLVHDLYSHDIAHFEALDTGTLGKWERSVTKPKAAKQVSIIQYFQERTGLGLPCFDTYSSDEAAALICKAGMHNLIGNSKKHIYSFPSEMMGVDDMHVYPLRTFERMDALLEMHMSLHQNINRWITLKSWKDWIQ